MTPLPHRDYKKIVDENVSRETFSQLEIYVATLLKWNKSIRLIADSTEADIWGRHIFDGLQGLEYLPKGEIKISDMGSGGGVPGLPMAAARPDAMVTLIESDQRKCTFLEVAAREMGLKNLVVKCQRLESLGANPQDVITARALASLKNLIDFSAPLRHTETVLLFHKGKRHTEEVVEARQAYEFNEEIFPSALGEGGALLRLTQIKMK